MPFEVGFFLGISLIISIGAQNIFVIKQGLKKQHSVLVPLICTFSDAFLILISVTTMGKFIFHLSQIKDVMLVIAILFLLTYGGKSLYKGFSTPAKKLAFHHDVSGYKNTRWKVVVMTLGFSLLNPQAVMEMVLIMGGIAGRYHNDMQWQFVSGAILASAVWFFSLTWVSRLFSRFILNAKVWRAMEILSGVIMICVAFKCIMLLVAHYFT